jgi:putative oxidoreductase
MKPFRWLDTDTTGWTILVRLLVGLVVFFPEGLQKLMFPLMLGAGRFAKIGIPWPEMMGPFVGYVEITCGLLIILGLLTRLVAMPLIIVIIVALISTKLPMLLGHDVWTFHAPAGARYGFWGTAHEARTDLCMLLGTLFLLITGGGRWSMDAWLSHRRESVSHFTTTPRIG